MQEQLEQKIITDCDAVAGELFATLHCDSHLDCQKSFQVHIYHRETLQEYTSKLALLFQHKVEVFIKRELLEPFQNFLTSLQEKYPMLFCRELAVSIVE